MQSLNWRERSTDGDRADHTGDGSSSRLLLLKVWYAQSPCVAEVEAGQGFLWSCGVIGRYGRFGTYHCDQARHRTKVHVQLCFAVQYEHLSPWSKDVIGAKHAHLAALTSVMMRFSSSRVVLCRSLCHTVPSLSQPSTLRLEVRYQSSPVPVA
jgi:hypothetical protein